MPRLLVKLGLEFTYGRRLLAGVLDALGQFPGWTVRLARSEKEWIGLRQEEVAWDAAVGMFWEHDHEFLCRENDKPVVSFAPTESEVNCDAVLLDNPAVGKLGFSALKESGCVQFAVYQPETLAFFEERSRGFLQMAPEARVGRNRAELMTLLHSAKTTKRMGIFGVNDVHAQEVLSTALEIGRKIPGEICVVGADDDEVMVHLSALEMSSVALPFRAMGYEAVMRVMKRNSRLPRDRGTIWKSLPTGVQHRQSTLSGGHFPPVVRRYREGLTRSSQLPSGVKEACAQLGLGRRSLEKACSQLGRSPLALLEDERQRRVREGLERGLPKEKILEWIGLKQWRSVTKN